MRLTGLQIRQTMIGRSFFAIVGTFFSITPALVYLVSGWVLSGGDPVNAGDIVAFTTLQSRLFFPIGSMLQVSTEVHSSLALFDRIFEYLDMRNEIEDAPGRGARCDRETVRGRVELRDVRFRYDEPAERTTPASPSDLAEADEAPREWTLDDVSMRIEPGQLAALVGPSGAGKTTITYLVPRLYDVQHGSVTIDGHDVRDVTLESLGENIGMVTQETYLFHTTIRRNLLYGRPDATHEELEAAARAAYIHDRIAELPDGLRHRRRGARLQALGRREAAARDRPRDLEGSAHPDPRRGHVVSRHDERAARAGGPRAADGRPDDDRDRAPPVDDPEGRRDLRHRPRPHRRAGHARRAARRAAGCTRACTSSSSEAGSCKPSARTA